MDASGSRRFKSARTASGAILMAIGLVAVHLPIALATSNVVVITDAELFGGLVEADQVTASCSVDSAGPEGTVSLTGGSAVGVGTLDAAPAPNTAIAVPGVGDLVLNKQTTTSEGAITVTGLSLTLLPILGAETIDIASVACEAETSTSSTPTTAGPTPTTESPSTTEAGPSTTTTVPGLAPTTTIGGNAATSVPEEAPDAPDEVEDPTAAEGSSANTTSEPGSAGVTDGNAADTTSDADVWDDSTLDGASPMADRSHDDTAVAGLMFDRRGGPEASGGLVIASGVPAEPDGNSSPWLTLADYAILAILGGSASWIGWTKLDTRRLTAGQWRAKRGQRWG